MTTLPLGPWLLPAPGPLPTLLLLCFPPPPPLLSSLLCDSRRMPKASLVLGFEMGNMSIYS